MEVSWSSGSYDHSSVSYHQPTLHMHPTPTVQQHALMCNDFNMPEYHTKLASNSSIDSYPRFECHDFNVHIPIVLKKPPWSAGSSVCSAQYNNSDMTPILTPVSLNLNSDAAAAEDLFNACHNELIKDTIQSSITSSELYRTEGKRNTVPGDKTKTAISQHVFAMPTSPAPKNCLSKAKVRKSSEPRESSSLSWAKHKYKNSTTKKENALNIDCTNTSHTNAMAPYHNWNDMKAHLSYQDYTEITELQNTYLQLLYGLPPPFKGPVTPEKFHMYASVFLQRRAKFFVSCPWYDSLGTNDRQHLLRVAVAISCYILGAQLIDWDSYTWPKWTNLPYGMITKEPTMPLYTLRQFLNNDQFVNLMLYCKSFSKAFSDIRVSLLLQTLSLFYPEPGVEDTISLEAGRNHYTGLLSRYLIAVHGHDAGQFHLQTLLVSQHEARQLAHMLNSIEIVHNAPVKQFFDAKNMVVEGIRLVCEDARERLLEVQSRKRDKVQYHNDSLVSYKRKKRDLSEQEPSHNTIDKIDFIQSTLVRLADCNDPKVLAEARRLIPVDLLQQFLKKLQDEPSADELVSS